MLLTFQPHWFIECLCGHGHSQCLPDRWPLLALFAVRRVGRRVMLITGSGVCSACMLLYAALSTAAPGSRVAGRCVVAFIYIYVFRYAATFGSIGPVVTGEVPSNRLRSKSLSIALSGNWICALAVICSVSYLINPDYANLGTKVGYIFGGLGMLVFVATIFLIPETKDRSLEEIDKIFLNVSMLIWNIFLVVEANGI